MQAGEKASFFFGLGEEGAGFLWIEQVNAVTIAGTDKGQADTIVVVFSRNACVQDARRSFA